MEELVGVPFLAHGRTLEGLDCWGLVRMAYSLEEGPELSSYSEQYVDTGEARENARLVDSLIGPWKKVEEPQRLDVVLMRVGRYPCHVGVVVRPGRMLHTYSGASARIEDYRSGHFKDRVVGFYRYQP